MWFEPLFAEAKDWHGMRRFRLRRLWRVNSEALMIAAGQNLKRRLEKTRVGTPSVPSGGALCLLFGLLQVVDTSVSGGCAFSLMA
ncbi:MAG TPA: transposase [Ktedonobacteraceae bacterium]|nr:transposase [Ktedonobacteraceae bacterium]